MTFYLCLWSGHLLVASGSGSQTPPASYIYGSLNMRHRHTHKPAILSLNKPAMHSYHNRKKLKMKQKIPRILPNVLKYGIASSFQSSQVTVSQSTCGDAGPRYDKQGCVGLVTGLSLVEVGQSTCSPRPTFFGLVSCSRNVSCGI